MGIDGDGNRRDQARRKERIWRETSETRRHLGTGMETSYSGYSLDSVKMTLVRNFRNGG